MTGSVYFDHIEVHVDDISAYCNFLARIFQGGRFKVISDSGTSMFCSQDGVNIEIKQKQSNEQATAVGFCNPCLRMANAKEFIENELKFIIERTMNNPDGKVYFFKDHEGITWHIKSYLKRDLYVNW